MDESGDGASLADVHAAQQRLERASAELHATVARARAAGRTWAQIGDVLGTSRQAAFKRFGTPRDPRTGEPMTPGTTATDAAVLTERVFRLVDAGDYDTLRELMTPDTAAVLTRKVVLDTWAGAVADTGNLVTCHDTAVELGDGSPLEGGDVVLGSVVGSTTLECEAGRWVGRVALDPQQRVVGLLVVAEGARDLPF